MKKQILFILIVASVLLNGCEKVSFEPEPENNPEALFEFLWNRFNTDYANFEERGVDWNEQYDIYRSSVTKATTDIELEDIFKQLLRSLDDGHVSLSLPNQPIYISNKILDERIDDGLFDLDVIRNNYLKPGYKETYEAANVYGWIGNVGYWAIKWQSDNYNETTDILEYFSASDGLIIDLRHSSGGSFFYTYNNFGPLTSVERFTHRTKTKDGPAPDDYSDWTNWSVYPSGTYFDKPIVVLTDRYTISAAERYILALRTLPNVIFIGDNTSGGLSTKIGMELANGWYYTFAPQKVESHDGQYFEGPGIPPDIYVINTTAEMAAGIDKTLEEAIAQF